MIPGIQIALVVLAALLVGALLPLLWSTLALVRRAQVTLVTLEERTLEIGEKTAVILGRAEHIAGAVEQDLPTLHRTADRVERLGRSVEQLAQTVRKIQAVSATIGPAIAAGLQAYRLVAAARAGQPGDRPDATPAPDLPAEVTDAILEQIKAQDAAES